MKLYLVLIIIPGLIGAMIVDCDQERFYHDNFGYGSDIKCSGLIDSNKKILSGISAYNEILLKIDRSNLTDFGDRLVDNLHKIRLLQITNSTIQFGDLVNLNNLQRISMENVIVRDFRGDIANLKQLTMNNCSLSQIQTEIQNLTRLERLVLSNNRIGFISNEFCPLKQLKYLQLDHNIIEKSNIECIDNLIELDLSYNRIDEFSGLAKSFRLKHLNLEGNRIHFLSKNVFDSTNHVTWINLKNNRLQSISLNLSSLRVLLLAHNRLAQLALNCSELEILDLSSNRIVLNPGIFIGLPNLTELYLSNCLIDSIPMDSLPNLSKLAILDISLNKLQNLDFVRGLDHLRVLNLSGNVISYLRETVFANMNQLQVLDLSVNAITSLEAAIFSSLSHLQVLNLSQNAISSLDDVIFSGLRHLQVLNIAQNRLQSFQFELVSLLPRLRTIDIQSNRLSCDSLLQIITFLRNNGVSFEVHEDSLKFDRENVEGISCGELRVYRDVRNIVWLVVLATAVMAAIAATAICRILRHSRRREYNVDEMELI